MISTFYPPYHFGGDATYVYRLSNALAGAGHRVDVVHDRDAYHLAHPEPPNGRFENHPNVTVYALHSRVGWLSPLATQQTGQPLFKGLIRQLLESNAYDVVHFNNISLIGPGALSYGRAVKFMTLHEHWLICPLHILWKFDREPCVHRQCLACTLYGRRPPQLWRYTGFLKRQLREVDRFLSASRFTRDQHLAAGLDIPVTLLPYFVPEPPGSAELGASPHPRPYFLFAGRLVKVKGLQTVLPVFKEYQAADLVVAGEGEYAAELERQARGLPNVKFIGSQPHSSLVPYYRHALALIVPSICYEVFPFVALEAMSVGTPVIARELGGQREAVQDSQGGLLFSDEAELKEAMTRLQHDPELRRGLGENGRAAFRASWTAERHLERYFQLIEEAKQRKQSAR